jgi:hypothetical protein
MTSLVYEGQRFDDATDWIAFVRDAINARSTYGLRSDVPDIKSALSQLGEDLKGTALAAAYRNALLRLIETGTQWEIGQIRGLPYAEAPGAPNRILALLEDQRDRFRHDHWIASLLEDVLAAAPKNHSAIEILRYELQHEPDDFLAELGARFDSSWFALHFSSFGLDPDGHQMIMWLYATKNRRELLDAIAAAGPMYEAVLRDHLSDPRTPSAVLDELRVDLGAHPQFRTGLGTSHDGAKS